MSGEGLLCDRQPPRPAAFTARRGGPMVILGRPDGGAWGILLAYAGEGLRDALTPRDAEALAEELLRMAELARRSGAVL